MARDTVHATSCIYCCFILKTKDGSTDVSYLGVDCFHGSAKTHIRAGAALWNNIVKKLLKPVNSCLHLLIFLTGDSTLYNN